ncbi:uncharacterized protein [Amphiura filiformis]|uniref:uncharacterized protein n=1 Tax=Amphiura filiformis TaxID=82378 RepID=UPI003B21ACD1
MEVPKILLLILLVLTFSKTSWSNIFNEGQLNVVNSSDSCAIDNPDLKNTKNQVVVISGNTSYECTVTVQAPLGTAILMTVLSAKIVDLDYLYVDTIETFDKRFFQLQGDFQHCQLVFHEDMITVHIRSDATIHLEVEDLNDNEFLPVASGMQPEELCGTTREYNNIFKCGAIMTRKRGVPGVHVEAICQLPCPLNCHCVLYDGHVQYTCANGTLGGYFIAYPPDRDLKFLDLSNNNVSEFNLGAFDKFHFINALKSNNGILTSLQNGIFRSMQYLVDLDLAYNAIHTIAPCVFQDLEHLQTLQLQYNNLVHLSESTFHGLFRLRNIILSNNRLKTLPKSIFRDQRYVAFLHLANNNLQTIAPNVFSNLTSLLWLYLNYNSLTSLQPDAFHGLANLRELHMHNNSLSTIKSSTFEGVQSLHLLTLDANKLTKISHKLWFNLPSLQRVNLSDNSLHDLRGYHFGNLSALVSLDLQLNKLTKLESKSFRNLENTTTVYVDDLSACCYTMDANCIPRNSGHAFLTCHRLLPYHVLKFFMWLLGICALLCNVLVIVRQCRQKKKSKIQMVQRLIILNLAVSDLLMGLYMIIITSADVHFGSFFPLHSEQWLQSAACKVASVLAITSSEASIFFVTLISIERALVVLFPFQQYKIGQRTFAAIILTMWIVAIIFGIVPTILSNEKFYQVSQVCIGLPLVRQDVYIEQNVTYKTDWEQSFKGREGNEELRSIATISGSTSWMHFSIVVFLGLNFICCVIIFLSYFMIFLTVKKTANHIGRFKETHNEEVEMATRMAAVVLTDFFCWMPIIIMGILVQTHQITLSPTVNAWIVTFLLPINSAVNPFLYTLVTYTDVYKTEREPMTRMTRTRMSESIRDPVAQRELVSMLPLS